MPFATANELNMFYRVFRNNIEVDDFDPKVKTMIVLHGGHGLIDHQLEVEHWRHFSKLIQLVFIDNRGCGRTEGGRLEDYSLKQSGADLYAFCQAMNINKPILAGVSAGGFVIMSCVIDYPTLPGAIILCNTEAKKSAAARKAVFVKIGDQKAIAAVEAFDQDPGNSENSKAFFEACVPHFSKKPFSLMTPYKEDWAIWAKQALEWSYNMDYRDGLKKNIQCPVLYLAGEDDPNHPLESSIETANFIPEKFRHFHVIPNAGAPVYQDQPEIFNSLVSDFIRDNIQNRDSMNN